jgi:hypothetical protein
MRRSSDARCSKSDCDAWFSGNAQKAHWEFEMIPSVRSMIVAMALTVIALSGGFGMFAAFRVNHDPLARLPAAATPMQLVANDPAPQALSFASEQSFGSRFELNEALIAIAAAGVSARSADHPDAVEPLNAVATVSPAADDAQPAQADAATPAPKTAAVEMPNDQAAPTETATEAAQPETAAIETPNDQAVPAATATEAAQPETAAPTAATPAAPAASTDQQDSARKITKQRRLAALRRARKARATAIAQSANQNAAFPQPTVQPAPQAVGGPFGSPPTAKRAQK